ncbi:hypothetical protein GCM10011583_33000 [Streptomyces camponoticapitis]|uniref:Uncharacterized protein n=1 Tax=Streptomyces camponoticapitis TaxID=1616125 RepID=A0ABQ2E9N9_9ACTN|nr:hypothetical protein [Streptomyces camponoticapitis]GGJ98870.1 hypothetical protein GCM10011583_33000 [Streptomyces camponoticapitis]
MERWDRVGRGAAYGAALALVPYALIKVSWVVGSLAGVLPVGDGFGMAEWVVLNTVTVGMAAIGITLALALVRPWGMRIPGPPVVFCAWVGSGFLVSILPFAVFGALRGGAGGEDPEMPVWEGALVQFSFLGMGLGLTLAVPAYLRRRWPDAFTGRLGDSPRAAVPWAAVVAGAVGLVWLYWALGGTAGIAHPAERNTDWHVLVGLSGGWALAAAAATTMLARARPARLPRRPALVICWIGSGSLFAWSGWKAPVSLYLALSDPAGALPPEHPAAALVPHLCAVLAGAAMLRTVLRTRVIPPSSQEERAA